MKISYAVFAALLLSGCGGMSVGGFLPFGGDGRELSRVPPNSIAYQCQAGKRFFLRYLDEGAAVWVILPEREFRLEKLPGDQGTRSGAGRASHLQRPRRGDIRSPWPMGGQWQSGGPFFTRKRQ